MGIEVKLKVFEGPLDLLLHLIEKNKVDIYDIPIAIITSQYMEYIANIKKENLDIVSDFLVMAATLLDIKSKMLLPQIPIEEENPVDPRAELVERLIEYKLYKEFAYELAKMQQESTRSFFRASDIPDEIACYQEPVNLDELLEGVTLSKLQQLYQLVMKRQEDRVDPLRSKFGKIEKEPIKVSDKIAQVIKKCRTGRRLTFTSLLDGENRFEVVVTLLAVLELIKVGMLTIQQERVFGEIQITAHNTEITMEELELEFK